MPGLKTCAWAMGLVAVGAIAASPAQAQPNLSDITGTNVWNSTAVRYGFEPLSKSGLVSPVIAETQSSIASLLNSGISSESQASLTRLSERLAQIDSRRWDYKGELDRSIRNTAADLARDLADARATCDREGGVACQRLATLLANMNALLNNLESFRASLIRNAQVSRTF